MLNFLKYKLGVKTTRKNNGLKVTSNEYYTVNPKKNLGLRIP